MAKKGSVSQAIVWVILGLLFIGLIGFGTTDFGGSVRSVGSVGDEEIETGDYARALQQELRRVAQESGRNFTVAEAQAFGIDRAVLAQLIGNAALDNEARRLELSVGDEAVRDQVTSLPAFQGIDGSFDREAYSFMLDRNGLTVAEFEETVRSETARNILQGAVVGAVTAPETFIDTLYDWARERRGITWARLSEAHLSEPLPAPSETDLAAYHEENAEAFTLGETKAITYALLTPEMMLETIEVDEDVLRGLYDERIDVYVQPERRLVERLVFLSEDEAAGAKARIDAGEVSFDDLVEERDLTLDDIDQGDASEADLGDAGPGVFALTEPGVVGPLPSPLGPALFRVNAILNATETPFGEAREELETEYAAGRARRAVEDQIGFIDDLLAGGATIEELTEETEMELGTIDWRPGVSDGVAAYQGFRDAALLAVPDDFPELIEFDEGGLAALRVNEIRPPALQPLEDVRADVEAGWRQAEAERRLTEQAQEAAQAIRDGAEMAGLDLPLRSEAGITREAFLDDAPPEFVEGVFQMSEGDIRVFAADGGAVLVRLDTVTLPDPDNDEARELKGAFSRQTEQGLAQDIFQIFTGQLQGRAEVRINEQAIQAVHTQFP